MVPRINAPGLRGVLFFFERIDIVNVVIEYIVVFLIVYMINYFMLVRNKLKYKKDKVPAELLYLKKIYGIKINKINYKNFVYTYAIVNTFIITTIYIILIYLMESWVLRIIFGIVLLILMTIICYGLLGRYYLWKEGRE